MNRILKLLLSSLALCLLIFWLGRTWRSHPSQPVFTIRYGNDVERMDMLIAHAAYCRDRADWAFRMNDLSSAQSWLNQAIADEWAAR